MSLMSRLISRLGAISVQTGALPLFSWSLVSPSSPPSTALPKEVPYASTFETAPSQDLRHFISSNCKGRKVFFVGEHHQQPRVLAAQMTMLDELVIRAKESTKRVVMVMEQFNVLQHEMLDKFCITPSEPPSEGNEDAREAAGQLLEDYANDGGEGFDLTHYMPLLLQAREAGVKVVGGFPPRAWAGVIYREGVDVLKEREREQLARLEFERWDDLKCSPEHAAYLSSLMSGEAPALAEEGRPQKPIHTAQAFKDAMLAHVIDQQLEQHNDDVLVFVVTGSGHCEYGFGAPERLRSVKRAQTALLVCKSNEESTIWQGEDWGSEAKQDDRVIADVVFCYDQV